MRLAVYTDYEYHRVGDRVYAERAFALFLGRLRAHVDRLVLVGRLSPGGGGARYAVGDEIELVPLAYYPSLAHPLSVLTALGRSIVVFWRALDEVDCVWLLGPHPFAIVFALLAALRRRRVVLGVRQDLIPYVRSRRPGRRLLLAAAIALESMFKLLARIFPVVTVGPEISRKYRRSRRLLDLTVSLVDAGDIVAPDHALGRSYNGELTILSVGRLETEKNPLMLADVLGLLNADGGRWRLLVCGEGELAGELEARLMELGQADRAELLGYVQFGDRLRDLYRGSHALLHTSWTEGLPQVLPEAFAAGLPAVTADVGGIERAVGDAAILVAPGDPQGAAQALRALAGDAELRERLMRTGLEYAREHTIEAQSYRLARFLSAG